MPEGSWQPWTSRAHQQGEEKSSGHLALWQLQPLQGRLQAVDTLLVFDCSLRECTVAVIAFAGFRKTSRRLVAQPLPMHFFIATSLAPADNLGKHVTAHLHRLPARCERGLR